MVAQDSAPRDSLARVSGVLLWCEVVPWIALAVLSLAHLAQVGTADGGAALGIAVCAALGAIAIAGVAWGWWRGSQWSYGAALTWQLLQVAVATLVWRALPALAVALVVASFVVAATVLRRGAVQARAREEGGS